MKVIVASLFCLSIIGLSNGMSTGPLRVFNGSIEEPHARPWQVKLILRSIIYWPCGGTLISKNYVLTAARCFNYKNIIKTFGVLIYLGVWDFGSNETDVITRQTNVNFVTYHEGYNETTHEHDIALIKLPSPVEFSDAIQPAKLLSEESVTLGQVGHISGWQYPLSDWVDEHQYLRGGDVNIVDNIQCQKEYPLNVVNDNAICALGTVATCYGDEGSPLTIDGKIAGLAIGSKEVNDWSTECPIVPNTYLYIPKYFEWIKANSDYTDQR